MKNLLALTLLFFSITSISAVCDSSSDLASTATLSKGRIKPLVVASTEFIKSITSKSKVGKLNSLEAFCKISTDDWESFKDDIKLKIEHIDLKKLLEMKESDIYMTISDAIGFKEIVRSETMSIKENTSYKKSLNKFWFKVDQFQKATRGEFWTLPQIIDSELNWVSISKIEDKSSKNILEMNEKYISTNENTISLEMFYTKTKIFTYSMLVAIVGIMLTVLLRSAKAGLIVSWLLILIETFGMTLRVMISGRAPITNMYETVLFSGFGALFIALIIYQFKKDKLFILGGLGYNILCLFMMKFADGMLSESISPLVPVLRDNFWLSTHVTTIILSYAALALSWMLANITLVKSRFGTLSSKDLKYYEELIYSAIKVGVVLLAAGIILGGVWADYSWGRFWGWDPKETWSLIVLLFYIAVLHGKGTNWINTGRFIVLSAAGFMSVMMAWFGVNYILATGLHSYGFSEGGAIFLGTFFITQIVIILLTGMHLIKKHA